MHNHNLKNIISINDKYIDPTNQQTNHQPSAGDQPHELDDQNLIQQLKYYVAEERRITCILLEHLHEVERRKLHLRLGYSSLYEFCTKSLGLSEGSAYRRISAMRLAYDVPEAKHKLLNGELSLSNAAKLQSFFVKKKKAKQFNAEKDKQNIIASALNTSTRECEKLLITINPQQAKPDIIKPITPEQTEIRMTVDQEFMNRLQRLKDLLSHVKPGMEPKDVFNYTMDYCLKRKDPMR